MKQRRLPKVVTAFAIAMSLMVGFAAPSSAGTRVDNAPGPGTWDLVVTYYPNPGTPSNTFKVGHVPLNVWQPLQFGGCSQEVRFGYFYNYPYAEMRYVSGTCSWGGVSRANITTASDLGGAGQLWTSPQWDIGPGVQQACVISGTQAVNSPCVQSGSGSIWNQQKTNTGPPRTIIGANAVICGKLPDHYWQTVSCLAVNYSVF